MENFNILFVILTVTFIGILALLLVANELGVRAKLGIPGRLALVGGLGLGVIAFTIKAGLFFYLDSLSSNDIEAVRSFKIASSVRQSANTDAGTYQTEEYGSWRALPLSPRIPADNQMSKEKVALGKKLFFDRRMSIDNSLSCASCHILQEGGDDNARVSAGVAGQLGERNAPSVWNAAFLTRLFWDGRARSLEDQVKGPLVNPVEMGMPSLQAVERKIGSIVDYQLVFAQVFGGKKPVTINNISRAIAAYERTLITSDTPYDRFVRGDDTALTKRQIRGMALFATTGCRNCHIDPTFSSAGTVRPFGIFRRFPVRPDNPYIKKYDLLVDGKPQSYRVPSLRNVALTAPYFHNGSVKSLEEAIKIMAVSQLGKKLSEKSSDKIRISLPAGEKRELTITRNLALSKSDISDIAAFLQSLTANFPDRD